MDIGNIQKLINASPFLREKNNPALFSLFIELYELHRIDKTNIASEGDMLLYQWGTYNWGSGEHFEINITRQIILDLEDPDQASDSMSQLSLTLKFTPSQLTSELKDGNLWCGSPSELHQFSNFIKNSAPYLWAIQNKPVAIDLHLSPI